MWGAWQINFCQEVNWAAYKSVQSNCFTNILNGVKNEKVSKKMHYKYEYGKKNNKKLKKI